MVVTANNALLNPSCMPIDIAKAVTVEEWELGKPPLAMTQCMSHSPDL